MARLARVVAPGVPHHLTQRGNRRQDVFFSDADRRKFLSLLAEQCPECGLEIWAYCLMTNHVHLVAVPVSVDSLGRAMRRVNSQYAAYVNRRQGWSGYLWQGRFYSTPLDGPHFWSAVRYVERNPVRVGLVPRAEDYAWSSAAAHCGLTDDGLLRGDLEQADHVGNWRAWLLDEDDAAVRMLRERTRTGRPCGPAEFVERLEKLLGRPLTPKKRGRKPKRKKRKAE